MSETANRYFIIPTALGQAMIADSIATGADINLTLVAVGDAEYVPAAGQTALMNERARVEICDIIRDQDNPAHLRICAILPPDLGGWHIHEVGILAENGNLFAVGKMDGSFKPLYTDGMCKEVTLDLILDVGAEANVNLVIDPHVIIATRQWVMDYIGPWKTLWENHIREKGNPHGLTMENIPGLIERLDKIGPGKHIGEPFFHPSVNPPVGSIRARGELFPRGLYIGLWAWVTTENDLRVSLGLPPLLVDEVTWQATAAAQDGYCPLYSAGDGSTTFRAPFYGRFFGAAASDAEIGKWVNDAMLPIVGRFGQGQNTGFPASAIVEGPFEVDTSSSISAISQTTTGTSYRMRFDSALLGPRYSGSEVLPKCCLLPIYIHAFNSVIPPALADMSNILNALDGKLDKATYEADAPLRIKAVGSFGPTGQILSSVNIVSCARTAVGEYTIMITPGIFADVNEMRCFANRNYIGTSMVGAAVYSTTEIRVRIATGANNLQDNNFHIILI